MGVQINSMQELRELIESTGLSINDCDELRELLQTVNQIDNGNPEGRKEEWAHKERMRELELGNQRLEIEQPQAHKERIRTLQHAERMRAAELGLEDAETAQARIRAIRFTLVTIPFVMIAAALSATYWLIHNGPVAPEVFGYIWGSCGLVSLVNVAGGLFALRAKRQGQLPVRSPGAFHDGPASARFATAITEQTRGE